MKMTWGMYGEMYNYIVSCVISYIFMLLLFLPFRIYVCDTGLSYMYCIRNGTDFGVIILIFKTNLENIVPTALETVYDYMLTASQIMNRSNPLRLINLSFHMYRKVPT